MLEFITTADGSKTIYNSEVGENYHSRNGALQESRHVFLGAGFEYFLTQYPSQQVSVLEVGFGTGLNFLLTADYCTQNQINLDYEGIEAYPLNEEFMGGTGYNEYVTTPVWDNFLKQYPDSLKGTITLNAFCRLHVANCKLLDFQSDKQFDMIYFDAFASAHQPEMWDEPTIEHTIKFMKHDEELVK